MKRSLLAIVCVFFLSTLLCGDGIRDDKDKCAYIEDWYDEQFGKNACKT